MPQTDGSLGSLLQGVSQQNKRDRIEGQCTEQINMLADVSRDLVRRPHTEHIADLLTTSDTWTYHLHDIEDEQYILMISPTAMKVFRLSDGVEQTIVAPSAHAYFSGVTTANLHQVISATTIGDYTILGNSTKNTALTAAVTSNVSGAVIDITIPGIFSQKYSVYMSGVLAASYTTPASGTTGLGVEDIATSLTTNLNASAFAADFTFVRSGATIFVQSKTGIVDFDISASSDAGQDAVSVSNNEVRDLSDLPKYHFTNKIIKVSGKDNSVDNDYYVKFDGGVAAEGVWEETLAPGLQYRLDVATMPHAFVRTTKAATDKFYFGPIDGSTQDGVVIEDWVDRLTGDDLSNPVPKFIGSGINFVSQWQNRLVMLSGPNLVMSKTNSFFNIFNKSALAVLDDDPIILVNPSTEYTQLRTCINHNRHLLVFSDDAQLVVKGTSKVTPITAALTMSSAYQSKLDTAQPIAVGASVMFPFSQGNYVGVRDYVTGATLDQNIADAVTDHVKKYIPGNPLQLLGSANHGVLMVRTDSDPTSVYIYQFLWQGNERVQSAWSKWTFTEPLETCFIIDNVWYAVLAKGTAFKLISMDLGDDPENLDFNVYADYMLHGVTPNVDNEITYPYASGMTADDITVISDYQSTYPGMELQIESIVGDVVTLKSSYGNVDIGVRFTSKYTPTMPQVKDEKGVTISTDNLIVTWMLINVADSFSFDFLVTSLYKDTTTQYTRMDTMGSLLLGEIVMKSGSYQVGVLEDSNLAEVSIETDSPYPLNLIDIEYRGHFQKRGQRI